MNRIKSTTVLAVCHEGILALGADGQATLGTTIVKSNVNKLRKLRDGTLLVGFAGSVPGAFALMEALETKMSAEVLNLENTVLALAKDCRTDPLLRNIEATMIVADKDDIFVVSGFGDVMRPSNGIVAVGSGQAYAHAAATALKKFAPQLSARDMVEASLQIAADTCIYTNSNFVVLTLPEE